MEGRKEREQKERGNERREERGKGRKKKQTRWTNDVA